MATDVHGTMTSDSVVNSRADADRAQFGQLNDNADTNIAGEQLEAFFHVNTDGTKLLVHPIYKEINQSTGVETYYDSEWDSVYVNGTLYQAAKREHAGDANTYDEYSTDEYNMYVGGTNSFRITTTFVSVNDNANDVDFKVKGSSVDDLLYVDAGNDRVGINTSAPSQKFQVVQEDSGTDTIIYPFKFSHFSTGTTAAGFGVGCEFDLEDDSGDPIVAGRIESVWTSASGQSDMVFKTYSAGANEVMRLTSTKNVQIQNSLYIKEQADADADIAGYGQLWINTETPNTLWFTDDAGTDFMLAGSPIRFGDIAGGDYSEFETDGTLEFNGDATVWKDINFGSSTLAKPAAGGPDIEEFVDSTGADTGIETIAFADGEAVSGVFEMQHDYKEGSDFTFHIHYQGITAPSGTDYVKWQLVYTIATDGTTLSAPTTITTEGVYDTQYETVHLDFTAITGTDVNIGDQFCFNLERVTAAGDAYAGDALLFTTGIHYEIDTVGSRTIAAK